LTAALWSPLIPDPRVQNVPAALEKDPYFLNAQNHYVMTTTTATKQDNKKPRSKHSSTPSNNKKTMLLGETTVASGGGESRNFMTWSAPSLMSRKQPISTLSSTPCTNNWRSIENAQNMMTTTTSRSPRRNPRRLGGGNPKGRFLTVAATAAAVVIFAKPGFAKWWSPPFWRVQTGLPPLQENDDDMDVPPLEFAHGTTTLSFLFQGGIIAAVDSRATLGSFVGSKTTQKVLPINSHVIGTMAGGAADCSFWIRKLQAQASLFALNHEDRRMSVARASRILSNALYHNRALGLSVGTMVMGFDVDHSLNGGSASSRASIFYVDNSGVRIEGNLFAVGSGSTYALGILDKEFRHDMTEREAIELGIKAIRHATFRDSGSGGYIGVYLITKDGWRLVFRQDVAVTELSE